MNTCCLIARYHTLFARLSLYAGGNVCEAVCKNKYCMLIARRQLKSKFLAASKLKIILLFRASRSWPVPAPFLPFSTSINDVLFCRCLYGVCLSAHTKSIMRTQSGTIFLNEKQSFEQYFSRWPLPIILSSPHADMKRRHHRVCLAPGGVLIRQIYRTENMFFACSPNQ